MSIQESLKLVAHDRIAVIEWDLVGEKVNKLSTPVMTRFRELLGEIENNKQFAAIVMVSRKSSIFIAGADIDEIKSLKKESDFAKAVAGGHEIMNMIEDLRVPVIAAIHGACLGGGCEMILACDYRIASDDPVTKIGLPEVKLGIIPGFGGCVRLPRTVGLQASLDIILAGKAVDARKAAKIGLVDKVVHPSILEEQAMAMARELIASGKGKRQLRFKAKRSMDKFLESMIGRPIVFSQAKKTVLKQTHGHYPAPLKALEVVRKTYGLKDRARALQIESEGFCEVAVTDVSRNLINVFFMMEAVKKKSGVSSDVKPGPINSIGVLGAGTMGGGIAYVAADRGVGVRLKDVSHEALARGFEHARGLWEKLLKKKKITAYELTQKMNLVTGGLDFSGFGQLDVVIEAIVEDMKIKQKVIGETATQCKPGAVIATNTSSLSVAEMAKGHPRPENFAGMHFFNPVDKMPLVEVIRGPQSSDLAVATIFELAKKMGKIPVVVKDGPGFLVNRLLVPYLIEAMFLLEEGMSIETVDRAYVREFGMPMGPFRLIDEVGLDVCVKVAKIFRESLGDRIELPAVMSKFGATGRLGRKNARGFYLYDERGKQLGVDQKVYAELGLGAPSDKLKTSECLERGIFTMVNEAALALIEDRIVETPEEVDLAMIMGTGFPPFRGGLLRYADSVGSKNIADALDRYAIQHGKRFRPSTPLANMAKTDRRFY